MWELPQRIDPEVVKRRLCIYIRTRGSRIECDRELFRAYPRSPKGGEKGDSVGPEFDLDLDPDPDLDNDNDNDTDDDGTAVESK